MSRKFTKIRLPGSIDPGLADHDEQSAEAMIESYRAFAVQKMVEAMEILDASDADFKIDVVRGVHREQHLRSIQEGRAA